MDDVRALASSVSAAEEQGWIISEFAAQNSLHLNSEKTEVVKISKSNNKREPLHLPGHTVETTPQAVCLGYVWSDNLSARRGVQSNINKALGFCSRLLWLLPWLL